MEIVELNLLKFCTNRNNYNTVEAILSIKEFPQELQGIYRSLSSYYSVNTEINELSVDDLANIFFATNPKDRSYYTELFNNLKNISVTESSVVALCKGLKRNKLQKDLALAAYDAAEGGTDKTAELWEKLQALNTTETTDESFIFVSDNLDDIVSVVRTPGLRWRLNSLNLSLGSLRKGNCGFVFARPETGKTTFICSEGSYMAEQIKPDEGPLLHFNNEQVGEEVMLRYYQSSLGWTLEQILGNMPRAKEEFKRRTNGKIKLYDNASIHYKQVEKICEQLKPRLIIFDQLDKVKGFDSDREDLRLGAIYIWARELAKRYGPVIAVCQADGTGEGVRWLTMGNVANAKTSKQAEADWILGIGKIPDSGYEKLRFFSISKNKLSGDDDTVSSMRHGKFEVLIDAECGRYQDIKT